MTLAPHERTLVARMPIRASDLDAEELRTLADLQKQHRAWRCPRTDVVVHLDGTVAGAYRLAMAAHAAPEGWVRVADMRRADGRPLSSPAAMLACVVSTGLCSLEGGLLVAGDPDAPPSARTAVVCALAARPGMTAAELRDYCTVAPRRFGGIGGLTATESRGKYRWWLTCDAPNPPPDEDIQTLRALVGMGDARTADIAQRVGHSVAWVRESLRRLRVRGEVELGDGRGTYRLTGEGVERAEHGDAPAPPRLSGGPQPTMGGIGDLVDRLPLHRSHIHPTDLIRLRGLAGRIGSPVARIGETWVALSCGDRTAAVVLSAVRDAQVHGVPPQAEDIAVTTGRHLATVRRSLRLLVAAGAVRRSRAGRYTPVEGAEHHTPRLRALAYIEAHPWGPIDAVGDPATLAALVNAGVVHLDPHGRCALACVPVRGAA